MRNLKFQQPSLSKMGILKFCQTLEEKIKEEIEEAYPINWDEDYITRRIVVALRRMQYTQIEYNNTYSNIYVTPFKLKGENENKFGDLAIIINIDYKDGDNLNGVAFLEAKRRYDNTNDYTALDFDQLKRIYENAPNARLLIYNYSPISTLAPTGLDAKKLTGTITTVPVTNVSISNLNTAIELNHKSDKMHKITIPFSYQLTFRYMQGMDLEFCEDCLKAAKGYLTEKFGMPDYTVIVDIKPGKKGDKEPSDIIKTEINKNLYAEITDIDKFNDK